MDILHRYTKAVLYSSASATDIAAAVIEAIKAGVDLRDANLQDADLLGAYLQDAYLRGVNLRGANLWRADLRDANLEGANLQDANLWRANLWGADLRGAYLWGADLRDAKQRVLQLQGSRHQIVAIDDDVRIGCHRKPLAEWLACAADVGTREGYSPEQIAEYVEHLRHIKRVLAMPLVKTEEAPVADPR